MDKKFILAIVGATLVLLLGGIFISTRKTAGPVVSDAQKTALAIVADDWVKGNKSAKVSLVEYLDFECPACGAYYPVVKSLTEEFGNEVSFVQRHFPLPMHKNGPNSSWAAEAAGKQGKYWEMVDLMFINQKAWGQKGGSNPSVFEDFAKQLDLNIDQFKSDVNSEEVRKRVQRDVAVGNSLGVNSTPTFYLNGEKIQNPSSLEDFRTLIKAAILESKTASGLGESVHKHADFVVYLNGKSLDFTPAKYQSTDEKHLDPDMHLHDGNGKVIHQHKTGKTLGNFFESIKMKLEKDCLTLDSGQKYCSGNGKTLKFYINGKPSEAFGDYEFNDLDKILISYGNENEAAVQKQIASISDDACLYSETCPERGEAPTENCVGGLGSGCE